MALKPLQPTHHSVGGQAPTEAQVGNALGIETLYPQTTPRDVPRSTGTPKSNFLDTNQEKVARRGQEWGLLDRGIHNLDPRMPANRGSGDIGLFHEQIQKVNAREQNREHKMTAHETAAALPSAERVQIAATGTPRVINPSPRQPAPKGTQGARIVTPRFI